MFVYIDVYIHAFQPLKNAVCNRDWYIFDQTLIRLLTFVLKQIDLVSFFFPLYGSPRRCLHYLSMKSVNLRPANEMAIFVLAALIQTIHQNPHEYVADLTYSNRIFEAK